MYLGKRRVVSQILLQYCRSRLRSSFPLYRLSHPLRQTTNSHNYHQNILLFLFPFHLKTLLHRKNLFITKKLQILLPVKLNGQIIKINYSDLKYWYVCLVSSFFLFFITYLRLIKNILCNYL